MKTLYLSNQNIIDTEISTGPRLLEVWDTLEASLAAIGNNQVVMPGDTQLRPEREGRFDRINAKPAYMPEVAGIKWIASNRSNIEKGMPRASGLTILNDVESGRHFCILDAALLNLLRTAGISMIFLRKMRPNTRKFVVIGAGPIGEEHIRQIIEGKRLGVFEHVQEIAIYDLNAAASAALCARYAAPDLKMTAMDSLEECFLQDNVCHFLCTSTMEPFIDKSLLMKATGLTVCHVGLRDYGPDGLQAFDHCFVDVWKSVCKMKTTVHLAQQQGLIDQQDCIELTDVFTKGSPEIGRDDNITLNSMGLPVYDLSVGLLIYKIAKSKNLGTLLD